MTATAAHTENRRTLQGVVESNKMQKTIIVRVERREQHPVYKKFVRRNRRYAAHDEGNQCQVGDRVLLIETRPLSKTKRWAVKQILERAK